MLRFLTIGLATAIVAAMLHWGSGSPQRATETTREKRQPEAVAQTRDRPKTAAEIAAIIAELKAPPPLEIPPAAETALPPAETQPAVTATALAPETVPPAPDPAAPAPETAELVDPAPEADESDLDAEFVAARFDEPEISLAVVRSRLPIARPASLRAALPAPDAPPPQPAPVKPAAVSLAIAEALQDTPAEPVSLALAEAMSDDLLYVNGSRVNLRERPSVGAAIVTRMLRGDAAHVLADAGDGWLHVRDVSSGDEGFMAEIFLSEASPPRND